MCENKLVYTWISNEYGDVIENVEFDFNEYQEDYNLYSLYHISSTDTFFIIIYPLTQKETYYTLWIEFSFDDPQNYTIYEFSEEEIGQGAWFGDSYLIGNTFYMGYPDITAIDIKTKKAYRCEEELGVAMKYADLLVEEWNFYEFSVEAVIDEVMVYRLVAAQGNDIPPFRYVYTAYRESELIGVLVTQSSETDSSNRIIYEEIKE